jgi:hypothetical protein
MSPTEPPHRNAARFRRPIALLVHDPGAYASGMKTIARTLAALVAVGLAALLVPVSSAHGDNCADKCNEKKTTCDGTCDQKRLVCIAQCGLPIPGSGYEACTQKCSDDAGRCSIQCQAEQKACTIACKLP